MARDRIAIYILLAGLFFCPGQAFGQSDVRHLEIGGHIEALRVRDAGTTTLGGGGRATIDLARWLALEGEFTFFPSDDVEVSSSVSGQTIGLVYQRRRIQALFGVKAGIRNARVGLFARIRPGFTSLTDRGVDCLQVCAFILVAQPDYGTEFAMDLGGTLEFYLHPRAVARLDVGDTILSNSSDNAPPFDARSTHNFATRAGLGFRF